MAQLVALLGFAFVSSFTPGPNNILLWASGATFGFRRTVPHVAGTALGLGAHEVVHVGDSLRADVAGAEAAGIRAVWVNRRGLPVEAGTRAVADLSELIERLAECANDRVPGEF